MGSTPYFIRVFSRLLQGTAPGPYAQAIESIEIAAGEKWRRANSVAVWLLLYPEADRLINKGNKMIKRKNTNGFSLIEVMAGMVILSTGLLLLLPMMVTSIRANNYAQNASQASMLIKDKMEDLKNTETPASGADSSASAVRTWTVTTVNSNLYRLDVSVRWRDERGYPHRNTMTSYTANR